MNNIVLWDRTKSAIVQEIAYSSRNYLEPIWSANGDKLLIGRGGLLSVTVNGDINTLFTLSSIPEYSDISQSRWSPNESQVGMWLWNDGKKESVLAIFDIPLNTINIYDIYRYDFTSYGIPIFSPPYWSPDGQYLLVHGAYSEGTETITGILILDVKSNTIYKISENSHAEGWVLLK
jgi:Tol biopolymer transport system component